MEKKKHVKGGSHRKSKLGILIGIPFLLFITGIILISLAGFNYFKYAFYISGLFIHDEVEVQNIVQDEEVIFPKYGEEYGKISIPSADILAPVYCGDSDEILLKGIGQFYGSRFPGERGNTVLSGHRNSVFKHLGKAKIGEDVIFHTTYGKYVYRISNIEIKNGTDQSIVEPQEKPMLTLYTCYPFNYIGNAPNRYVVTADLIEGTQLENTGEVGQ